MKFFRSTAVLATWLIFTTCFSLSQASAKQAVSIINFHPVSEGIYRGARPELTGIKELSAIGVKVSLNLDDDAVAIKAEKKYTQQVGMQMISRPMSGFWSPTDAQIKDILGIVANPANRPIYIHCKHGQDRTGLVVALYRITQEGWTPAEARKEMLALGFHTMLLPLNHYFEEATGYED